MALCQDLEDVGVCFCGVEAIEPEATDVRCKISALGDALGGFLDGIVGLTVDCLSGRLGLEGN